MSTNVLLQSMSSLTVGEIPKFVQLENRYKCVVCDGVLQVKTFLHTEICLHTGFNKKIS